MPGHERSRLPQAGWVKQEDELATLPGFDGRRVVVTGAASGIGRAVALAFARAGARLFVCDVANERLPGLEAELLAAGAGGAHAITVDVGARAEMAGFCES